MKIAEITVIHDMILSRSNSVSLAVVSTITELLSEEGRSASLHWGQPPSKISTFSKASSLKK